MRPGNETPANATAARVMAKGEHFAFSGDITEVCADIPLPIKEKPKHTECLAGVVFGRLRVIGLSASVNSRWVCRCICGNYVLRKATAIKRAASDAACQQCRLLAIAKRNEFTRRTGKLRDRLEFMQ